MATLLTVSPARDVFQKSTSSTAVLEYKNVETLATNKSRHLAVSPYLDGPHLLDLQTLDLQSQLFALALQSLTPADQTYATTEYSQAFQWDKVMSELTSLVQLTSSMWHRREFYVVEFRSQLKPDIDREMLFTLDRESHREATQSGGLLKYWFGIPDVERRNLATCLWRSKEDAIKGGKGPWHRQARNVISKMYDQIDVRGLRLVIEDDVSSWRFEPFST